MRGKTKKKLDLLATRIGMAVIAKGKTPDYDRIKRSLRKQYAEFRGKPEQFIKIIESGLSKVSADLGVNL